MTYLIPYIDSRQKRCRKWIHCLSRNLTSQWRLPLLKRHIQLTLFNRARLYLFVWANEADKRLGLEVWSHKNQHPPICAERLFSFSQVRETGRNDLRKRLYSPFFFFDRYWNVNLIHPWKALDSRKNTSEDYWSQCRSNQPRLPLAVIHIFSHPHSEKGTLLELRNWRAYMAAIMGRSTFQLKAKHQHWVVIFSELTRFSQS